MSKNVSAPLALREKIPFQKKDAICCLHFISFPILLPMAGAICCAVPYDVSVLLCGSAYLHIWRAFFPRRLSKEPFRPPSKQEWLQCCVSSFLSFFFLFLPPVQSGFIGDPARQGELKPSPAPLARPVSPIALRSKRCAGSLAAPPAAARASFQPVMQPKRVFLTATAPSSSPVEFRLVLFTLITPKAGLFAGL